MKFKRFIPFILVLAFLSSCTISKRKYLAGYTVEWKHSVHTENKPTAEKANKTHLQNIAANPVALPFPERPAQPSAVLNRIFSFKSAVKQITRKMALPDFTSPIPAARDTIPQKPMGEKHIYGKSTTSFILGLLSILIPLVLYPLGFVIFFPGASDAGLPAYIIICLLIWFIVALNGFVTGIKAVKYISRHHDKSGGLGLAIIGVILSGAIVAFFGILLLVILFALI